MSVHPVESEEVMAYLEGELPAARAAEVAAHVERCSACQAVAADLRRVSAEMAAWKVPPSPESLVTRVNAALPATPKRQPAVRGWFVALAAVTSFMILVAIAIPNLLRSRSAADQASRMVRMRIEQDKRDEAGRAAGSPSALQLPGRTQAAEAPAGPMIIRTASLCIITREFDNARAAVEHIVRQHGGYVAQLGTAATGGPRVLNATLRLPTAKLDAALAELKKLGRVETEQQSSNEITQQYVDLVARLSNARNTEQRLIEVLRERTGKVGDVLAVEKEIARVREEIERMEAERKHLENQVGFATVQLQLQEERKAELVAPPSVGTRLWNALVEGYRSAAETALGLALFALSYGPPLLVWVAVLLFPARWLWRRVKSPAT